MKDTKPKNTKAELLSACQAIWEADRYSRVAYIDEPDEALTRDARKLRDAWRAIRDAITNATGVEP